MDGSVGSGFGEDRGNRGFACSYDEDILQGGEDKEEDTGAQDESGTDFFDKAKPGTPEKREGNDDEVDIRCDIRGERRPDDKASHGGLAAIARVGANLPVLVEGNAANEDYQHGGEPSCDDEGEANVNTHAVTTTKTVLRLSQLLLEPRTGGKRKHTVRSPNFPCFEFVAKPTS